MRLVSGRDLQGGRVHFDEALGVEPAAHEARDLRPSGERGRAVGVAALAPERSRRGRAQRTPGPEERRRAKTISTGLCRQNRYVRAAIANPPLNRALFSSAERAPNSEDQNVRVIASSIRKGNIIEREDGQLCVVLSAESFHPGKGTPTTQIDMRRLSDGVKVTDRFKTTEQVERAFVEDKNFDFLYSDADGYHFMNADTYDQIQVPADVIGDQAQWLQEGMKVILSIFNEIAGRHPVAAPRHAGSDGDRAGDEGPDRVVVLQARQAFEWRAGHGSPAHRGRNADRPPDRGRQLRRAGQGLSWRHGAASRPLSRRDFCCLMPWAGSPNAQLKPLDGITAAALRLSNKRARWQESPRISARFRSPRRA